MVIFIGIFKNWKQTIISFIIEFGDRLDGHI